MDEFNINQDLTNKELMEIIKSDSETDLVKIKQAFSVLVKKTFCVKKAMELSNE